MQIPVVFGTRAPNLQSNPAPDITSVSRHRSSLLDGIFSDNNEPHQSTPTVTNPRRRVTICTQPKYSLLNSDAQRVGNSTQRQLNNHMRVLEEEDSVCDLDSQPNMNTLKQQRRRFTICTQPRLHSVVTTQQESEDNRPSIYDPTQPNYTRDSCFDIDTSVNISLVSDLKRRFSVFNQGDSILPYSVLKSCQQDNKIPNLQEIKNGFEEDYNHNLSQHTSANRRLSISSTNNSSNSTRKVGYQLQTIASQVSQRLSNQWQSNFPNQFRRFHCEHM